MRAIWTLLDFQVIIVEDDRLGARRVVGGWTESWLHVLAEGEDPPSRCRGDSC